MVGVSGEAVFDRIEETRRLISELEPILQSLMLNDSAIIDGLAQMLGSLQQMHNRTEEQIANLSGDIGELGSVLQRSLAQSNVLPPPEESFDRADPELSLLRHLAPLLPNPMILDVGANVGLVASSLVGAGYEVFAFEPYPPSFKALTEEAKKAAGRLHPFPYAIGAEDGEAELLVACDRSGTKKWDTSLFHSTVRHPMLEDLAFGEIEIVPRRTISSLAKDGRIPNNVAALKVDTEGADLDVLAGAEGMRFSLVLMEFWDRAHPFGRAGHGDLGTIVNAMRARGYPWHIQIFRVDETSRLGYYCNMRSTVSKAWGNVIHFSDFALFARAAAWCARCFPDSG
jgi:FkbM family methyltransferase